MIGTGVWEPSEAPDELVEYVAREIQVRGLCAPAVLFLEAARPYQLLGSGAMLFFDPVLRRLFADTAEVHRIMADDDGIERLIERLEEIESDITLDA